MDAATGTGADRAAPSGRIRELAAFSPRLCLEWDRRAGRNERHLVVDGSLLFADVAGFTALSERLAAFGRVGAEEVSDLVHHVFGRLLDVAYANGGDLLKFGGDAMLLLFEGADHEVRGAQSAVAMRRELRSLAELDSLAGRIRLRMTQGLHSGPIDTFLVGGSHRELVVTGRSVTTLLELEAAADVGEILVSPETARALPDRLLGEGRGHGRRLVRSPGRAPTPPPAPMEDDADPASFLATSVRQHLAAGGRRAEHRQAIVAFVAFTGTEAIIREAGGDACAEALDGLLVAAQAATDASRLALLGSDIAPDGGKLILVAGAPVAHPDDADRLLRTARQVVTSPVPLRVRAGVNGGSLFAGIVGPPYRLTYTVMGDTVNLAARLAARAAPGEVLAVPDVVQRARIRFDVRPLEPFTVKGKRAPVEAVAVGDPRGVRVEQRPQLPLIGRDGELDLLEAELRATEGAPGRVVELVGPPGIGKSRLLHELRDRHPELRLYYASCDAYEASTPYFAFRDLLRFLLEVDQEGASLEAAIRGVDPTLSRWAPLIGSVVDLPTPPTPDVEALDPHFRTARLQEVVGDLLVALLPERAMLRIEDIHWMDEASRAMLDHLVRRVVPTRSWLLVVTSREPMLDGSAHRQVHLEALDAAAIRRFAHTAVHEGFVTLDRANELAGKAEGNPLFLEELLTYGLEHGDDVPDSIEHLIAARLDRLPPEQRDLLRHAALLGARFELDLLGSVTGLAVEPADVTALGEFVRQEPDGTFAFEHDLFREVAYAGLPYRHRRVLHDRVARSIEAGATGRADDTADTLALHYHRAGRYEKSWEYARVAARRATARSAPEAAVRFLRWALDDASRMDARDPEELVGTWTELGDQLETLGAYGQAEGAYRRARRLAAERDRPALWYRSGIIREREGRYTQALRWYGRGVRQLEAGGGTTDAALLARIRLRRAEVYLHQGRTARARREVRGLLAAIDELGADDLRARAHFVLGWALRTDPEGEAHRREALALYERLGDLDGQAIVQIDLGVAAYYRGAWEQAVQHYERARELKERIGDSVAAAISVSNVGEVRSDQGRFDEADDAFTSALLVFEAAGFAIGTGVAHGNLGRVASRRGRFASADEQLDTALRIFRAIGASSFEAEMRARRAELELFRRRFDPAGHQAETLVAELAAGDASPTLALAERVLGVTFARRGRTEDAVAVLRSAREHADAAGSVYDVALSEAALGWTLARDDPDEAADHAAAAGRVLEPLGVTVPSLRLVLGPDGDA